MADLLTNPFSNTSAILQALNAINKILGEINQTLQSVVGTGTTGTGAVVLQNSPTINTPSVTNINVTAATVPANGLAKSAANTLTLYANSTAVLSALPAGNVKLENAASFSANASVATVLGSVGPSGSHTTVQKWLTIVDSGGSTLYIPCF